MQSTLKVALVESLRYRGFWGQWSWLAHRLSGLAVLLFLLIHVWDTANATFWPEAYSYTVEIFKWFPFSVGEIALMAAVLFHAFNGMIIGALALAANPKGYERYHQDKQLTGSACSFNESAF